MNWLKKHWRLVGSAVGLVIVLTWAATSGLDWKHIAHRSLLHFGWAPWTYLSFFMGFHYLGVWKDKLKLSGVWRWVVPWGVALLTIFLREPADVAHGGPLVKSYIDLGVWAVSLGSVAWLIRWIKRHA